MSDLVDPAPEQPGERPAADATGVEVNDADGRVRPTGLFVAGVGRSGTSIATRLAMSLGLRGPQPEDVMPANAANPTGYWESNSLAILNDESLLEDPQAWVHDVYDFARSSGLPVAEMDGLPELVAPSPQDGASLPPAQQRLYDLVRDLTGVHASFPPLDLPPTGEAAGPPIHLDRVVAHSAPRSASARLSAMAAGLGEEREMIRADHERIVASGAS